MYKLKKLKLNVDKIINGVNYFLNAEYLRHR